MVRALCLLTAMMMSMMPLTGCPGGGGDVSDATASDDLQDGHSTETVTLGTHPQWKQQPEHFVPLDDDSELPIVLGHQGLWMVVLAIRSHETLTGELDLIARVEVDGDLLGELQLINQALDPELDGHDYLYDIWLVVSDPSLATYTADVTVELEDSQGVAMTMTRRVLLSGGNL